MSRYRPEAPAAHRKTGILLANLGTPDAPTKGAVRRYLAEFLADPRVVELPRALWLPLLRGVILPLRSGRSAQKYAAIWTREGSPLAVHSERQARLLKGYLAESGPLEVLAGMSYGNPSIAAQLTKLSAAGCDRILVLPMFPQYSASASGAVFDAVARWVATTRRLPELRLVRSFASHPGYIAALAESVRAHWARSGRASKLVISFHGLPQAQVDRGDPYLDECRLTAHRLTRALALDEADWTLSFQSRFGRGEWLKPSTSATLATLAREGTESVDVICPGFVSDCLETLEEIELDGRKTFIGSGGKDFRVIPCLNERDAWIRALAAIVRGKTADWLGAEENGGTR